MIRGLSPLARLDEMHPTLAKFSIPAGGELREQRVSNRGGGGISNDGDGPMSTDGLSLSKAFETIEARKAELQVCVLRAWFLVQWMGRKFGVWFSGGGSMRACLCSPFRAFFALAVLLACHLRSEGKVRLENEADVGESLFPSWACSAASQLLNLPLNNMHGEVLMVCSLTHKEFVGLALRIAPRRLHLKTPKIWPYFALPLFRPK